MSIIFSRQSHPEAAPELLRVIQEELKRTPAFVLWLQAEMGAGKTSFVRSFLYRMGLPLNTPVVSPTYTIMNEYCIGEDWYAHLDLYRADAQFSLDEIGVLDTRVFRGIFVEWPEQAGPLQLLPATHSLHIEMAASSEQRFYTFEQLKRP